MTSDRRHFLRIFGLTALATQARLSPRTLLKPPRLKLGDTVGLVNPASPIDPADIKPIKDTLATLGLKVKLGSHLLDRYGYLAGKDADRAADINMMFADTSVQAILTMRGGWGCNRILPLLDYELIRSHPKILLGYSDITSLLNAIYARSDIVTFHGPVGTSTWNAFTLDYVKRLLFARETLKLQNPLPSSDSVTTAQFRVATITPGKARGRLVGGNLSVLTAMVGSPYLPPWKQTILFLEETGEDIYRVDRMLTQLKLAGILHQIAGFIFGQCTDCGSGKEKESLTLMEVLRTHILPLEIPAWYGSAIGHIQDKFTLPVGVEVEIDALSGTIQMLESAVV